MENNQCPNCKAELADKQECASCGTGSTEQATLPATPVGNPQNELRNVSPLPPVQTPPEPQTPKTPPREAQRDPGLPFLSKELRDLKPVAEKFIKQKAHKKGGVKQRAAAGDYTEHRETNIGQLHQHFNESRERHSGATTVSLMDLTAKLPEREPQIPGKEAYDVQAHLQKLKERRVIFMSCVDGPVAMGAAYALLDEMNIASEQKLSLNFARNPEKSNLVIQFFTQLSTDDRQELTAIVIDGFNPAALAFLDWLQITTPHAVEVRSHLQRHRFFLLCLVAPSYLEKYSNAQTYATWEIGFIHPLLKHSFPSQAESLERQIRLQQRSGKWKQTESELCSEIRGLLDNDLPKIVEQRRDMPITFTPPEPDSSVSPERLFKGGHSIEDTLLYAATYFSDLPPHEFDQLVDWLLADRTTAVTVKTQHHNPDGTTQIIETEVQKPLRDFWSADPDSYLATCEIEASTGPNLTTSIGFANEGRREKLKAHLERHHSMYLLRQFRILESNKFLTSAPHISDRAMSLSLDMATAYPGSFGKEWLLNIILDARNGSKPSPNTDNATVTFDKNKALERITLFVRLMLERPQLEEVVSGLLKDLMSLDRRDTVLFLVRGLQFAPGFDEFYWIKRLLDEGESSIKDGAYYHLYSYIQKIGIYPLLSKLEQWIPTDERPFHDYSPSCIYSLRLFVEYCSELSDKFEEEQTPPRHPLFAFSDENAARDNCRRLITWLFHPGMPSVFAELDTLFGDERPEARVLPFICELVLEWIVVLRDQESAESAIGSDQLVSTQQTQDFLIESLAVNTTPNQRAQILLYWERLRDFLGVIVNLSDASSDWIGSLNLEEKRAMLTTRRLVKDLIKRFRTAIRTAKQRNGKVLTTV